MGGTIFRFCGGDKEVVEGPPSPPTRENPGCDSTWVDDFFTINIVVNPNLVLICMNILVSVNFPYKGPHFPLIPFCHNT